MGSLMSSTPYSEVTATLEVLDHLGVRRENLARVRSERAHAKRVAQAFHLGGELGATATVEIARDILGETSVFGVREWRKYFGRKVKFTKAQEAKFAEVPWSEDELRNPGINQKHFLNLGVEKLGGKPLNLPTWHEVFPGPEHPKFYLEGYLTHQFAQAIRAPRWYLMPVGIVKGSNDLVYGEQTKMLPAEYEVPNTIERVTANILFHLLNSRYLDEGYWARTSDQEDEYGYRVILQGFPGHGLYVRNWREHATARLGVAASRRIPS